MNKIEEQLDYLTSLSAMVVAYEEIAANRMQKIRQKVLYTREFSGGLGKIFSQVKTTYQHEAAKYKIVISQGKKEGTARVFISANTGLYGDIIQRTFNQFISEVKKGNSYPVVIGQLGKRLYEETGLTKQYTYFDFPDAGMDILQAKKITDFLRNYESVVVYHGLFQNIIKQEVATTDITGSQLINESESDKIIKEIFEPSLFELLDFFEKEIFSSLFIQSVYESHLAKFSSRMATLDVASQGIEKSKITARLDLQRLKHQIQNKKQLGSYRKRI